MSNITNMNIKNVLLFGAGMVAMPVIRLLGNRNDIHLYVASDQEKQAMEMIQQVSNYEEKVTFVTFKYPEDLTKMSLIVKDMNLVISLLPATMHISIAQLAIEHKVNMVTKA